MAIGSDRQSAIFNRQSGALQRITIDPKVCHGKPYIRGHRVWVSLVLDLLADGLTTEQRTVVPLAGLPAGSYLLGVTAHLPPQGASTRRDIAIEIR